MTLPDLIGPVIPTDGPCLIEVITLANPQPTPVLKVRQNGRAIGYFRTPEEVAAAGVDLATATIRGAFR